MERRHQSAEELLTALLEFRFSQYNPRKEHNHQQWTKATSIGGVIIGLGVVVGLLWRLVWILKHKP